MQYPFLAGHVVRFTAPGFKLASVLRAGRVNLAAGPLSAAGLGPDAAEKPNRLVGRATVALGRLLVPAQALPRRRAASSPGR